MHLRHFKLPEFATDYSVDGTEVTCWIPSQNDKQFCVIFEDGESSPNVTVSARVIVDGVSCGGREMRCQRGGHVSRGSRDSVSTSTDTRRPLVFARRTATDDDAYLDAAVSPELGCIKVVLRHVKLRSDKKAWKEKRFESQILHERSKKAISHSVQFGAEFGGFINSRRIRSEVIKELATFVFKYRPLEFLRAEGIAPREPGWTRTMRAAETLALEARLRKLKQNPSPVKQESGTHPIFQPGEIIDLT
ncbi:hypothetical protein C8R43DRAFT_997099 [Mycena crocata]|nr:hypothetical protein C8R43DRAFT_997099 [Mycena crocata]